ncbi:MAG: TIGR04076 family protein [Candidatus Omnitrophica bacterium]|nr:TIGR04076 family protein [Candidatus Omnitrophota bacterium]MCM8788751.1 TIGR04076 family protein [Candidatus Omnitrophota bacterium]
MKYSVVKVTVKNLKKYCPFYKKGDFFIIKQQCFDSENGTVKQYCMHSLHSIYPVYMDLRKQSSGTKKICHCPDDDIVEFELQRLEDEEGRGWNRPEEA